jgi:PAS domain S-box-containing protein
MLAVTAPGAPELSLLVATLEELPTGVWVARAPGGEFVYANRAFAEITGTAARGDVRVGDYSAGYQLRDRAGLPFPEERLPFMQALRRRETVVVDGIVIEQASGARVSVRALGKPLFDNTGAVTHVMVAFIDITSEVTAQTDGRVAQEQLHTALQHAPIILFARDRDGMVTVSEGAGLRAMGFRSGELVGRSVYELYKDNPEVLENGRRAMGGETFTTVTDLGQVVLETWMAPLRDADGTVAGMIGVSTDITERLRMQRQVAQAERLAALGRLAASVAHEINNPLAYAMEALRLAGEALATPTAGRQVGVADLRQLLKDATDGMDRVRLITRDLTAFSRADEDARSPQSLNQAVTAAAKMVASRTGTRARLELGLGPEVTVLAGENRLVQIFVNLIVNAADALPVGRAATNRIDVTTRLEEPAFVRVEVTDNGPGVPENLRDKIFDPFFTTKPVGEGTGLGLFVTRNLVEALGGTIALDKAPGGGARVSLRLPTVAAPAAAEAVPQAPPASAGAGGRPRVLIVDDEPQLAHLFKMALAGDYDVQSFTSGRTALAHLEESEPYDLILCDLMMADVSGMKLYEELRRLMPGRERALVFMTGGVFDPQVGAFLASVPNDCVDKPFDIRTEVRRRLR